MNTRRKLERWGMRLVVITLVVGIVGLLSPIITKAEKPSWAPSYTDLSIVKIEGIPNQELYLLRSSFSWSEGNSLSAEGHNYPNIYYEHEIRIGDWGLVDCVSNISDTIRLIQAAGEIKNEPFALNAHSPIVDCARGSVKTSNIPKTEYYIDTRLFDTEEQGEVYTIGMKTPPVPGVTYSVEFLVQKSSDLNESSISVYGSVGHWAKKMPNAQNPTPDREDLFCRLANSILFFNGEDVDPEAFCVFRGDEIYTLVEPATLVLGENFSIMRKMDLLPGVESEQPSDPDSQPYFPPDSSGNNSIFTADVTIPDGTTVSPGSTFTKTWTVKNAGLTTWTPTYRLQFQSGHKMGGSISIPLGQSVSPGQFVNVSASLTAPSVEGSYRGYWRIADSLGQPFGDILWVDIDVASTATPINTAGVIKLYSTANYNGLLNSYGQGDTNSPSANSYSLEIPSGWSVVTYRTDNYGGESRCWYESVANLQDHSWQNSIQSMKVYNYNYCTGGQKVKLYKYANMDQVLYELDPTSTGTNVPNKDTYSMQIPPGWSVKTWDQDNNVGRSRCWTSSVANLQDHESWHLSIDSMRIYTSNECGTGGESFARICKITGAHAGADCTTVTEDIPSLGNYGFGNDAVKSVWMQGPWELMLFEHDNYQGQRYKYRDSNNDIRNYPPLENYQGYGTSSLKVRLYDQGLVTFYREGDYNDGNPFKTDNTLDNLEHWDYNNQAKSVKVKPGYQAVICSEPNFHGICGRLSGDAADLNSVAGGLRGNVSSVRVCNGVCDPAPTVADLLEPVAGASLLPADQVNFYWSGQGESFYFELSGGNLTTPINSGWTTNNNWIQSGLSISSQPYAWRVKAWNQFGESGWSNYQQFYIQDIPVSEFEMVGPATAYVNDEVSLYAYTAPFDASNLIFTWSPEPVSGQGTAVATYSFDTVGEKPVSLSVSNSSSNHQDTRIITITELPPSCEQVFCVNYYNSTDLSGDPVLLTTEPEINHDWGAGGPGNGVNSDQFSAIWTRLIDLSEGNYEFSLTSDDGAKLYVDGELVIDAWQAHALQTDVGQIDLIAGMHVLTLEYYEVEGDAVIQLSWEAAQTPPPPPPPTCHNEFCVDYFNDISLGGSPIYSTTELSVNHDWGGYGPGNGVPNDYFSTRWIGNFDLATGDYEFSTASDDGVRLWVDGTLVIDNWTDHGYTVNTASSTLSDGVHEIKLEYYEKGGGAVIALWWEAAQTPPPPPSPDCIGEDTYCVRYYPNRYFEGEPSLEKMDDAIDQDWGGSGPTNTPADNFSAVWQGNFDFSGGDYTFYYGSDDGMRMWLDGQLVIDNWYDQGYVQDSEVTAVAAGRHLVKVEYYENGGGAAVSLWWEAAQTPPPPPPPSEGVELLTSPWHLSGNGGASELYQGINSSVLAGKTTLRVTYDLHGLNALGGDASAIIFDQNGWKYVSLSNYGINGLNGVQTVDIPLSAFSGLNLNTGSTTIHTRFWYGSAFTVDITSIKVL